MITYPGVTRALLIITSVSLARYASAAQVASSPVVFSGQVVDLQGGARIGVPVTVQVLFQNNGRPINAFDPNNPDLLKGKPAYDPATAQFFLPINTANIPATDGGVSLRFIISGQIISTVNFLSAFKALNLDVVVPDPQPDRQCYSSCRRMRRCCCCVTQAQAAPGYSLTARPQARSETVLASSAAIPQLSGMRTWTNMSGSKTVLARLTSVDDDRAHFERDNGEHIFMLFTELSTADQELIRKWQSMQSIASAVR